MLKSVSCPNYTLNHYILSIKLEKKLKIVLEQNRLFKVYLSRYLTKKENMTVQPLTMHSLVDYQKKAFEIKNQPIAELFRKVLKFQGQLERKISEKNQQLEMNLRDQCSWKNTSFELSKNLMMGLGGAAICFGMLASGTGLFGIGGVMSYVNDNQSYSIEYLQYEIAELKNESEYVNSMLVLLEEFDKADSAKRSEWIKNIGMWYHCQDTTEHEHIVIEDIFGVLQDYLSSEDAIKRHLTMAIDQGNSDKVRNEEWACLQNEMGCVFYCLKVNKACYTHQGYAAKIIT
jgi:hypothetical protein